MRSYECGASHYLKTSKVNQEKNMHGRKEVNV